MRYSLLLALTAGCTVDVGAGSIDPITIDQPIDPTLTSPPVSLETEAEFLSVDDSNSFADKLGNKLGAVKAIDLEVKQLGIFDSSSGAVVAGSNFVLSFEGVTLDHVGQRVRLPATTKQKVLGAVSERAALTLPVQVTVDWSTPSPPAMGAHALLQPIVIVDEIDAL